MLADIKYIQQQGQKVIINNYGYNKNVVLIRINFFKY